MPSSRRPSKLSVKRLVASGLALVLVVIGAALLWPGQDRPTNVVLIVIDTLRADHLQIYDYERKTSPRMRRTLWHGAVFDRAYSHAPWTAPSVASLLTSLPVRDHGITRWEHPLAGELLTLPEVLLGEGFQTHAIISHTVLSPAMGFDQGFAVYDVSALELGSPSKTISSQHVTDRAIAALEDFEEPFFLMLHYFDPHNAYMPHEEHRFGATDEDLYDGEIAYTDQYVGRFLSTLGELGHKDDTLVVLLADHGEEFRDHGGTRHTNTLYEELVRVPLVIRGPGIQRHRVDGVVRSIDLAPTILTLLGLAVPQEFSGGALPLVRGRFEPGEDRPVFMETRRFTDLRAVVLGDLKLIRDERTGAVRVFDLAADPEERSPVSPGEAEEGLLKLLDEHYAQGEFIVPERVLQPEEMDALRELGYIE